MDPARLTSTRLILIVSLLIAAGGAALVWMDQASQARRAAQAYVFALPLVLMDVTREQTFLHPAAVNAGPDRLYHIPVLSDHTFRTVVRPNVDTIYSTAWLDLSREPVVLDLPPSDGRYHVFQFMDAWTNVFFAPGIRTLGNEPGRFFLTGPGWAGEVPAGYDHIPAPTHMVWLIGRIFVAGESDLTAAARFQREVDLRPYSRVGDEGLRAAYPDPAGRGAARAAPLEIVRAMSAQDFYTRFLDVLRRNPPSTDDSDMISRVLQPLGLAVSEASWDALPLRSRRSLQAGMDRVLSVLTERAAVEQDRGETGWAGYTIARQLGAYGTHYELRAAVALFGLGANLPDDAIYLNASGLPDGTPLVGGRRYELTFPASDLPPVRGFWSLTVYDRTGFLIDTGAERYGVRSSDPLRYNPDGSLTLLIQSESPGEGAWANWLPAPASGDFVISMRLYWPEEALLSGDWLPPAIRLVEGS